jgi:RNA polymerase sigma-70 factor (ECF subfamily)
MSSEATAYLSNALSSATEIASSEVGSIPESKGHADHHDISVTVFGTLSDLSLLAKIGEGSREAFGELFRRHRRVVLNVACRILKDASEAEDLCQEVFLHIFQKANLFNSAKGAASSWIMQIAYSRALNRRQYLTTRQHYVAQELNEEHIETTRDPLFVDSIMARSLLTSLQEHLSEEQRQTLELHFFDGYSLREIAQKTGQGLGNIRHHFYRGLERLRSNVFPQKDI